MEKQEALEKPQRNSINECLFKVDYSSKIKKEDDIEHFYVTLFLNMEQQLKQKKIQVFNKTPTFLPDPMFGYIFPISSFPNKREFIKKMNMKPSR